MPASTLLAKLPTSSRFPQPAVHTPYTLREWFDWLQANTDFDRLILDTIPKAVTGYMSPAGETSRRIVNQVLRLTKK